MSGSFEITILSGGRIRISGEITNFAEAVAFARAWDGAATGAYADDQAVNDEGGEDAGAGAPARHKPISATPGTRAHDVLTLLQQGVTDTVAIADKLDMATNVAGRLKTQLIMGGHWTPPETEGGAQ